ncbi:MAG: glycosidase [Actinobacteria bacterium]|nr:glycosidase [Actinomycetota bacterium]
MNITVNRKPNRFYPNPKRVITRFFMKNNSKRPQSIIQNVIKTPDENADLMLNEVLREFSKRHRNITKIFESHFNKLHDIFDKLKIDPESISLKKRLLIGSYFTMEYSIESIAFFNPSIVEDPDQFNLKEGQKRIIVSFRGVGEGHISSIMFRSGVIDKNNNLKFEKESNLVDVPEVITRYVYDKKSFIKKLYEMNIHKNIIYLVMDKLGDKFIYGELQAAIADIRKSIKLTSDKQKALKLINWVASSHYEITFSLDTAISERVIFPISYTESNGIEDARFTKFTDDDGHFTYYATYTAYNGHTILPKLMETKDFYHFRIMPLNGECAQDKDLALFPRKISGKFAMISRHDGVNNYIMFSDNINVWQEATLLQTPQFPWEFVQIGNSGPPIETEKGWLLITHGVGPMRKYCLGAMLLDREDPTKVIGQLHDPLLMPNDEEREGYVPNVIYSCGSIINNNELIIAYSMSDSASTFASVPLEELFSNLLNQQ